MHGLIWLRNMEDFTIQLTGITQSLDEQLHSERIVLNAINVLLSLGLSRFEKRKYEAERERVMLKITEIQNDIQESRNPSQLTFF